MPLLFHRKPAKGIRSDAERERAAAQVDFLRAAVEKVRAGKPSRRGTHLAAGCEEMLHAREAEIREYDGLKSGEWKMPQVTRLDQLAALLPRIRIAHGVSQTELARRLGVSKQVVSRCEESDYQTVGLARLQEIFDALGVQARIELKPQ